MQEALQRCGRDLNKNALTLAHYCLVSVDKVSAHQNTPAGKNKTAFLSSLLLKSFNGVEASKLTLAITRLRGFVSHLLNFVVMWFGLWIGGWW